MEDKPEPKVTQTYSIDPVIVAWATQKAAQQTQEVGKTVSASAVVNDILKREMIRDLGNADATGLRKLAKAIGKKKALVR